MATDRREGATREFDFSHCLARGLRRNLFQAFADQEQLAEQAWSTMRTAARPFRSNREKGGVARLAATRMAASLRAFQKTGSQLHPTYSGFELSRFDLTYDNELFENQIAVARLTFTRNARGAEADLVPIGFIGAHAIERMFQRCGITSLGTAEDELCSALPWMNALSTAVESLGSGRPVHQLPIPTTHGTFLAQCMADSGLVWIRTWVCAGSSDRIDNTVDALRTWHAATGKNPTDGFRSLLSMPAHRWLCDAYQPN